MTPSTRQPSAATVSVTSASTAAWIAVSRTMPFLRWARPASNCGLISAMSRAGGRASASAAGSTSLSEMKLTSMTTRLGGGTSRLAASARMSVPSSTTTSARARSRRCSWSCPTSTA